MQSRWQGRSPPCGDLPAPWYAPTAAQTSETPTLILSPIAGIASLSSATPTALPALRARASVAPRGTGHRLLWPVMARQSAAARQTTKTDRLSHSHHAAWLRLCCFVGQPIMAGARRLPGRPGRQIAPPPKLPPPLLFFFLHGKSKP